MSYHLRNNVIRDPLGRVKVRTYHAGGREHYHIGVWLEADSDREMDHVARVEYLLHPSFRQRERSSANRSNDLSITIWSWGTFLVQAKVHLVGGGEPITLTHDLVYDLPPDDPENYVDVSS
jgi:transcription initiation factor IIF auxiliary subunit